VVARPSPGKFHLYSEQKQNQGHTADFPFPHLFHPLQIIGNQQAFPGIRRSETGFEGDQFPGRDRCLRGIGLPDLDRLDNPQSLFDQEIDLAANDSFLNFLANPDENLLVRKFFTRLTGRTLPLDRHPIEKEQTEHLLALLGKTGPTSTHILLYGDPGTGKTSYAQGLIRALKQTGYQIVRDEENKSSNRRAAIVACLNLTRQEPRPIIIVDEADNLLNAEYSWFRRGETQDKGWLNQLLEEPGLRMIWITNDIGSIEDSVLRRFAYSLRFKPFNRRQRVQLWENVLKGQKSNSRLDGPEVLALAKKYRVSAGGVELVVRKALEAGRTEKKAFHRAVELGLSAHQTLLNGGIEKPNDPDRIETGYCLEGLNLEGDPRELMTCLAPGDFKVVRDRFAFVPGESITHQAMVTALKEEAELKMVLGEKKVVGF